MVVFSRNILVSIYLLTLVLGLTGCSREIPGLLATQIQTPTITSTSTLTVTPPPTLTALPSVGLFLAPPDADPVLAAELDSRLSQWIPANGYRYQVRPSLSGNDLENDNFRLVVALNPNPEISSLAVSNPGINFLTVGILGLEPASNLSTIGADENRLDQQGFIAGYIAAMITPDWRVGVIGYSDTQITVAARQAFFTGVKFYCGLCLPIYPPFYEYPLYFELGEDADSAAWRSAADFMIHRSVETVYVVPGAGDNDMFRYLAEAGIKIIGGEPPLSGIQDHWIASLRFDLLASFIEFWPEFVNETDSTAVTVPLQITDINPELLSPGKLRLVEETLEDVLAGYIDLGVEARTSP